MPSDKMLRMYHFDFVESTDEVEDEVSIDEEDED